VQGGSHIAADYKHNYDTVNDNVDYDFLDNDFPSANYHHHYDNADHNNYTDNHSPDSGWYAAAILF